MRLNLLLVPKLQARHLALEFSEFGFPVTDFFLALLQAFTQCCSFFFSVLSTQGNFFSHPLTPSLQCSGLGNFSLLGFQFPFMSYTVCLLLYGLDFLLKVHFTPPKLRRVLLLHSVKLCLEPYRLQ